MIDEKKFIDRLLVLMQESGVGTNAQKYGELVGCTGRTISSALKGKVPGIEILNKIAERGASISWLIGETDQREYAHDPQQPVTAIFNDPGEESCYQRHDGREKLVSRFRTLFDFLEETYPDNSIAVDRIAESIKHHLRNDHPDYRFWEHEKEAEIEEAIKKRVGRNMEHRPRQKVSNSD